MDRLQHFWQLQRAGWAERRIARELRIGRNTARAYRLAIAAAGLLQGEALEVPGAEALTAAVRAARPRRRAPQQVSKLLAWDAAISALLEQGLGPHAIYGHLRREHADFHSSLGSLKRAVARIRRESWRRA